MEKYEYKSVSIGFSVWTGRAKSDYLEVLNEYGAEGWRFVDFAPNFARPKGVKGIEMIFERKIIDAEF